MKGGRCEACQGDGLVKIEAVAPQLVDVLDHRLEEPAAQAEQIAAVRGHQVGHIARGLARDPALRDQPVPR